jgi:hypothetical protein
MRTVLTTILAAALTIGVTLPAAALLAALGFVIMWPIRRLFRRNQAKPSVRTQTEAPSGAD